MKYAQGQGTTVAHGGRDDGACKREAATVAEWRMVRWVGAASTGEGTVKRRQAGTMEARGTN